MKRGIKVHSGSKKGVKLKVPKGIRPTKGLLRRSLFDRMGPWIKGKRVLELFAGTGAIGFEALSRSAREVVFVEISRRTVRAIKENAEKLGLSDRVKIIHKDSLKAMRELIDRGERFDFIFADPPYKLDNYGNLMELVHHLLEEDGIFVLETHWRKSVPKVKGLNLEKEVRIGDAVLRFYSGLSG
jgi:16S rRNA (guanine(966)-N(2))-methyltransferase RsmD